MDAAPLFDVDIMKEKRVKGVLAERSKQTPNRSCRKGYRVFCGALSIVALLTCAGCANNRYGPSTSSDSESSGISMYGTMDTGIAVHN